MKYPDNRREIETLPVDLLGFIFYPPSPRNVGKMTSQELRELTDTRCSSVAVFVDAPVGEVRQIIDLYGFSHVQLHGGESPVYCRKIRTTGVKLIKAFQLHPLFSFKRLNEYAEVADFFLFDTKTAEYGGSGMKFDWNLLDLYELSVPFFLSGGVGPQDADIIPGLSHPAFQGIDLNSGFEDSPGLKNRRKLELFIKKLDNR